MFLNYNNDKSKIAYIFKACWMSKGEGGHKIWTMTDKGGDGGGGKKSFCRTSFVHGPIQILKKFKDRLVGS